MNGDSFFIVQFAEAKQPEYREKKKEGYMEYGDKNDYPTYLVDLFNKSANRGECLQPCRRAYIVKDEDGNELKLENNTVMSAKDLCSLEFIDKLKKAGVKAFKIEGRNREPEYVDKVVRVYRKALKQSLKI